jgi:hypothetical protein
MMRSFDWLFYVIIGIPFVIALLAWLAPGALDRFVREWPWEARRARLEASNNSERPEGV